MEYSVEEAQIANVVNLTVTDTIDDLSGPFAPLGTFDLDDIDTDNIVEDSPIDYKFNEGDLIAEFQEYIDSTYKGHYATNKFQSTEVIIERGHGTGFCMGNVDKYSNRYGKKGSRDDARKDLMKVLHYALIQLYIHDTQVEK